MFCRGDVTCEDAREGRRIGGATILLPPELLSSLRDSRFICDGFPVLAGRAVV
ncbi:MAG: hypothetical protein BroJett003_26250 [Planctomycetota bacterium]|nr:MAG: hypothetical protein BroJett003_26250 [Planctomycetota bacterium]